MRIALPSQHASTSLFLTFLEHEASQSRGTVSSTTYVALNSKRTASQPTGVYDVRALICDGTTFAETNLQEQTGGACPRLRCQD